MPEVLATGIDVSEFNGDVDFAALKGQIDFAIIRCGYGSDYPGQEDAQYAANVRKCLEAGIPFGVYLYSYARTPDMARSEAAHTLRLIRRELPPGERLLYGVWYDVEDSTLPTGRALADNCLIYWETIRAAGYYCGLYSSLYWMETRLNDPRLDKIDKWVAQWNDTLEYRGNVGMWQYSSNGILNGKRFDRDRAFRDYPKLILEMEEGTDMTREEVAELAREEAQRVYNQNEALYRTIDDTPRWARAAVEQVYRELDLGGTGEGDAGKTLIDASRSYVRALYVIARLLDRLPEEAFQPEESPQPETDPAE